VRVFLRKQHAGVAGRSDVHEDSGRLGAIGNRGQGGIPAGDFVPEKFCNLRSNFYRSHCGCCELGSLAKAGRMGRVSVEVTGANDLKVSPDCRALLLPPHSMRGCRCEHCPLFL
jgi:hypothetical protein